MPQQDWRVVRIGLLVAAVSLLLLPLPLVTGAKVGRFIVVIGLVGLLIGFSIAFNALIDRWRGGGGA
jgi:hypothetical protein